MGNQVLELVIIILGSINDGYYDYDTVDGYKYLRYWYLTGEQLGFLALCFATLIEPVFVKYAQDQWKKYKAYLRLTDDPSVSGGGNANDTINNYGYDESSDSDEDSVVGQSVTQDINGTDRKSTPYINPSSNSSLEIASQNNFFLINSVLSSIYYCMQQSQDQDRKPITSKAFNLFKNMMNFERDKQHSIDLAEFYESNKEVCIGNVTNGSSLRLTIFEYGAIQFNEIRQKQGHTFDSLLESFAPIQNWEAMQKFQEGSGKSECFFFFTGDGKFVIKTIKELELRRLIKKGLIEHYSEHLKKNPKSLLARIYGVYKIKVKFMHAISIIVMDNIAGQNANEIQAMYDLKGSRFQRFSQPKKPTTVLKDNNFMQNVQHRIKISEDLQKKLVRRLERDKDFLISNQLMDYSLLLIIYKRQRGDSEVGGTRGYTFHFKPGLHGNNSYELEEIQPSPIENKNDLIAPLTSNSRRKSSRGLGLPKFGGVGMNDNDQDVKPPFDTNNNLSNNSLEFAELDGQKPEGMTKSQFGAMEQKHLFGFKRPNSNQESFIQFQSIEDKEVYYRMGIIDFLQKYGKRKRIEYRTLKIMHPNVPANEFSCQPTKEYGERFYNFMKNNLFS